MRIVIIGNGLAGTIFAKTVREIDSQVEIDIFAEEKYLYYPRPNLIEFMAGNLPFDRLFAFPEEWYRSRSIGLHLGRSVQKISAGAGAILVHGGGKENYDILLLANGASSFIPPFKGADKKGVFALRSLDDALNILDFVDNRRSVVLIGGGLLGLEIARALRTRGLEVKIVEFFPRLLPRQLDSQGADLLKGTIEKMGMEVHLGRTTEEILGEDGVTGISFKGGEKLDAEAAVVAAGVRPNIQLAQEAGLDVDRGVVVDDYMRTSRKEIFAAGDGVQHNGRVYGIIPASFQQARTAALNVFGLENIYTGTVFSNTLKVVGIDLTSIGNVNPEEKGMEEIRFEDREKGIYKKIVLEGGKVKGAIWMGTKKGVSEISRIISQETDVGKWKSSLLDENFDWSSL
jgi:nitrite reductase (NADH) large subunit